MNAVRCKEVYFFKTGMVTVSSKATVWYCFPLLWRILFWTLVSCLCAKRQKEFYSAYLADGSQLFPQCSEYTSYTNSLMCDNICLSIIWRCVFILVEDLDISVGRRSEFEEKLLKIQHGKLPLHYRIPYHHGLYNMPHLAVPKCVDID